MDSLIRLAHLYDLSLDDLLLTGSNLVKDLKIKRELKIINILSIPLLITILSLTGIMIGQKWVGDLTPLTQLNLALILLINLIPLGYFTWKKLA